MLRIKENNCFNYQISSILEEDNHLSFLKLIIFSAVIGVYYMYIYKHCVYLAPEEARSEYEVPGTWDTDGSESPGGYWELKLLRAEQSLQPPFAILTQ